MMLTKGEVQILCAVQANKLLGALNSFGSEKGPTLEDVQAELLRLNEHMVKFQEVVVAERDHQQGAAQSRMLS